ncbi:hypothetical protein PMAYCL1PPCAC_17200, partial [Pristionchus mayeri]
LPRTTQCTITRRLQQISPTKSSRSAANNYEEGRSLISAFCVLPATGNVNHAFGEAKSTLEKSEGAVNDTTSAVIKGTESVIGRAEHAMKAVTDDAKQAMQGLADSEPGKAARHVLHDAGEKLTHLTK